MSEIKELYVRKICNKCGNERELIDQQVYGYKGVYAETIYRCDTCQELTTYGSELSLFGDYILRKDVVSLKEQTP